jgi:hypothetical protein
VADIISPTFRYLMPLKAANTYSLPGSRIIFGLPRPPVHGSLIKMASPNPQSVAASTNNNLFQCGTCSQSFTRIDHLGRHVRSRTLHLGPSLPEPRANLGRYARETIPLFSVQQAIRSRVRALAKLLTLSLTGLVTSSRDTRPSTTRGKTLPPRSGDAMGSMSHPHEHPRHAKLVL